jgi:hypothetical protein
MEWRSVVFSDELGFCLYASDGGGVDVVSVISRSAFAQDTKAPPHASWFGSISYIQLIVTFGVFLQVKVRGHSLIT